MNNYRIFVEKRPLYRVEAESMRHELNEHLGLAMGELRLLNVYDLFGFSEELLDNLMFSGKSFVTGIAHGRRPPHMSCIFKRVWPAADRWEGHDYPSSAFKIGGCGFACVLIETKIIKAVYEKNGSAFAACKNDSRHQRKSH